MDLYQLKIFETVIQCGSFSNAALQLGISQSAVSRAIASLEDELKICIVALLPRLAALPIPDSVCIRSIPIPLERRIGVAILSQVMHPLSVLTFLNLLHSSEF
jgi:hypothetical protein